MTAKFSPQAALAIQGVFDDPTQNQLAERVEEILDLLDSDPGDRRVRKHRMQTPKFWAVPIHGSGRDFVILWDFDDNGVPNVRYAGEAF